MNNKHTEDGMVVLCLAFSNQLKEGEQQKANCSLTLSNDDEHTKMRERHENSKTRNLLYRKSYFRRSLDSQFENFEKSEKKNIDTRRRTREICSMKWR